METKKRILEGLAAGVVILSETWERKQQPIELDNYCWFDNKRAFMNKNQPRGSGGVGFFIHNKLCETYHVKVISKDCDGIIALSLTNKISEYAILFIGVYIPT